MNRERYKIMPPIIIAIATPLIFSVAYITTTAKAIESATPEATTYAYTTTAAETTTETTTAATTTTEAVETTTQTETHTAIYDWDADEEQMLLKIAMAEAEDEPTEGKALVMNVVLNRIRDSEFPTTIKGVIFQRNQFTTTWDNGRYWNTEPNEDCRRALEMVRQGWDGSAGALYFDMCDDSWAANHCEYLFTYGGHNFYR